MPQAPRLFDTKDIVDLIREPVSDEQAVVAERVVWGWLKPVLGLEERPQEIGDELFSWAVELGAIAVTNPDGKSEHQVDNERSKFGLLRRQEILTLAASGGTDTSGSSTPAPVGRFPRPQAYPDPAERSYW